MPRLRLLPAVAVVAAALWGCSGTDDPPESSAADAPVRSTTTLPPPPPTLERSVADPAVFGGEGDQRLSAVAVGVAPGVGGRLVAVGSSDGGPAVWSSADGSSWARVALPAEQFGPAVTLDDVAPNPAGGGWVVVGGDGGSAAAWMSPDGERWRRAAADPGPPMTTVGATSLGLVAFGAGADGTTAWSSFLGDRWARAVDAPAVFDRPGAARVVSVVSAGREVRAVVEREGSGPEIWHSADTVRWSAAPPGTADLLPAAGQARAGAATSLGSAMVVVGADAKPDGVDGAMWLSTGIEAFEQVPHDEAAVGGDGAQTMTGVAPAGDRLVVVGTESDEFGDLDAAVWASSIGSGLERGVDDGRSVPGDQHVVDVAVLGATPVAVGWEQTSEGADAVAWTVRPAPEAAPGAAPAAAPGLRWQRVAGQDALSGSGEQRMEAITAGSSGWVAAGSVSADQGGDGAVWRSSDGRQWSRADDGAMAGPGDQRLHDVAAGPAGLVAVGVDGESAAIWTSADAASWERGPSDDAVFGGPGAQEARAVVATPGDQGWVVVGADGGGDSSDAAVWVSTDGGAWARVPDDGALGGPGDQRLHDVAAGPAGLVAVGVDGESAAAWTSADGRSWAKVDLGPGMAAGVGLDGVGALVAGGSTGGDGRDGVVWRSGDGTVWERVGADALAGALDQELAAVAAGEGLTVAVGRSSGGGGDDAAAWTSSDGAEWARSPHDEEVLGGDQAQVMAGVAVAPEAGLAVAVGRSGSTAEATDAAVWVTDLRDGGARSRL